MHGYLRGWLTEIAVTSDEFRTLALSLPDVAEGAHMGHPDFRVRGKIFATLGYPDEAWGMIKLKPEQQAVLVHAEPAVFRPVKGGWGRVAFLCGAFPAPDLATIVEAWPVLPDAIRPAIVAMSVTAVAGEAAKAGQLEHS